MNEGKIMMNRKTNHFDREVKVLTDFLFLTVRGKCQFAFNSMARGLLMV